MIDAWIDLAIRIQSIAQAGLQYGHDAYDMERYAQLREIAAEMMAMKTDLPVAKVRDLFCNETGYQTPKVDTRGAIFENGKILLVHESNGNWALPGGWCDVDMSAAENTEKEILEETGLTARAVRLIALQDWRKHNRVNNPYGVLKVFMLCEREGGQFVQNLETTETAYFGRDELPENLAVEKTTEAQILMCFDAYEHPETAVKFD